MQKMGFLILSTLLMTSISCSNSTPAYIAPFYPVEKLQDSVQSFEPKVDILFVVDNSGSMGVHQTRFGANIDKFTSIFLKSSVLDYNIGVITTSTDKDYYSGCCGILVGTTKIVTKETPKANEILAKNLLVGTSGDVYEKVFDPTYLALTEPLLSTQNKGFLRPDATLVVIFITDAEDQSKVMSPDSMYDHLLMLKNGDKTKVFAYGAIVPSNDQLGCQRDENRLPTKIEFFLSQFKNKENNIMNLCDPNFGLRLSGLATDIVENSARVILLNRPPDVSSIAVTFGDRDLPNDPDTGWIFDPARNAVVLGKKIDWLAGVPGSKIKIYYNAAKYDE